MKYYEKKWLRISEMPPCHNDHTLQVFHSGSELDQRWQKCFDHYDGVFLSDIEQLVCILSSDVTPPKKGSYGDNFVKILSEDWNGFRQGSYVYSFFDNPSNPSIFIEVIETPVNNL